MGELNQHEYADKIRRQYTEKEITKMDELRELDNRVKRPAKIFAYIFGTLGALVLGVGMCLAMKVIGTTLAYGFTIGIMVGVIGIVWVIANYFIYQAIMKSSRNKYSKKVITLTDELLNK